ncbi:TfoX/Sxy family protein [Saccharospirillum mangrovi]|uniref:TfoX/Sxy family protein n=1 Tax=Saccharospirillum mangrovi TaxID=2161747 RepID=UPI000D3DC1A7|nr:TfoX/Sxy family protein [Saccharospirillum mangrovi]
MLLTQLRGLGPKSAVMLAAIDIHDRADLERLGPVRAYLKLKQETDFNPSLNLLYAMVGALEDRHWADITPAEKVSLLMEMDGYRELLTILDGEDIRLDL